MTDETNVIENATPAAEKFDLQSVEKAYFSAGDLEKFIPVYEKLNTLPAGSVSYNFDLNDPAALDGRGILVLPVAQRKEVQTGTDGKGQPIIEKKSVTQSVFVASVPDPDAVLTTDNGRQFVRDVILDAFATKIGNAVRPRADGKVSGNVPFSLTDFIEARRGGESLKVYNEVAKVFLPKLHAKGLKMLTTALLRQVLASQAYADMMFNGKIGHDVWAHLLNGMIAYANEKGMDPAVLRNWLDTRQEAGMDVDLDNLDLSDL